MSAPSSQPRQPPAETGVPIMDPDRTVAGDLSAEMAADTEPTPTMPQAADDAPHAETEWPVVPGYQILALLGRGGMGVVYKARQVGLGRHVALKMILGGAHASPEDMVRFLAEGEAVALLQHTNIVQIYQVGRHGEVPFFSLEYVDGGSLAQRLDGTPQQPRDAARLIECLARAMHLAHQKGIIHRDLKPSNILLASGGRQPPVEVEGQETGGLRPPLAHCTPKITDFGLAKRVEAGPGLTQTGVILGTPSYMAPEQAEGKKNLGPAADIYALGAILYEMLTGRPPFHAPTPLDTILQVLSSEPVPPARLQPGCPRDLETICLKCLHKEAAKRYATAEALADDLQRYLTDRPILARRTGSLERTWRWCRRNPVVASLLAVVAACIVVAALLLNQERTQTISNLKRAEGAEKELREQLGLTEAAEREKTDKLWASYLAEARARRWSGKVGRRFDSLAALAQAARIRFAPELRDEAIACMTLVDLRLIRRFPNEGLALDAEGERYARADEEGALTIYRMADDTELCRLPGPGLRVVSNLFSPDGRFLLVRYQEGEKASQLLQVWNLDRQTPLFKEPVRDATGQTVFSPNSRTLAIQHTDGVISLHDLATSKEAGRMPGLLSASLLVFSPDSLTLAVAHRSALSFLDSTTGKEVKRLNNRLFGGPFSIALHPTRHQVAISRLIDTVEVYNWDSGKLVQTFPHPAAVRGIAWGPDGNYLTTACADFQAYVWDAVRTDRPPLALRGHSSEVTAVRFSERGDLLATNSWDGSCRLWDLMTGKEQFNLPGDCLGFSRDDQYLFVADKGTVVYRLDHALECRALHGHEDIGKGPWSAAFSPDGRLLASASGDGVILWDVAQARECTFLPVGYGRWAPGRPSPKLDRFHSSGVVFLLSGDLLTSGNSGLYRWPVATAPLTPGELHLGPPQRLDTGPMSRRVTRSRDGKTVATLAAGRVVVLDAHGRQKFLLNKQPDAEYIAVAPDGKWVATSPRNHQSVQIWDGQSGKLFHTMNGCGGCIAFSPDGQWLATAMQDHQCLWRTGTWELAHRMKMERQGGSAPLAFSEDGKLFAVCYSHSIVDLYDPATGQRLARLEPPESRFLPTWLAFSADGGRLALATENHVVYLWDLRRIRNRLEDMGLAPDWPAYPPAPEAIPPVRAEVDAGPLGRPAATPAVVVLPPTRRRPAKAAEIAAWVKQLGDADAKRRQAAADALAEVGTPAVKALTAVAEGPEGESRRQARAVLDRIAVAETLAPTHVRLKLKDAHPADAIRALAEQSHLPLTYAPGFLAREPLKRITLELDDVPVWEALDRICEAGGLGLSPTRYPLQVSPTASRPGAVRGYTGPFRLGLLGAHYYRSISVFDGLPRTSESLELNVQVLREPKLQVALLSFQPPRLTEARGPDGQSLLLPSQMNYPMFVNDGIQAATLRISLKPPDQRGGKIQVLKGVLPVEIAGRQQDLVVVPHLSKAQGRTFRGEQRHQLTVEKVQTSSTVWRLQIRLIGPPGWRYDPNRHGLEMIDARGRSARLYAWLPLSPAREPQPEDLAWLAAAPQAPSLLRLPWPALALRRPLQERMEWRGLLQHYTATPLESPVKLRLYRFERLRTELPFELRDVPLP